MGKWRGIILPVSLCLTFSLSLTAIAVLWINGNYAGREKDLRQWATTEVARGSNIKPTDVPCDPPSDVRTSDLCAQWKAADAAKDSANWGQAAFWLSAISSLVAAIIGVVTLLYLKKTFEETSVSAKAAQTAADAATAALRV